MLAGGSRPRAARRAANAKSGGGGGQATLGSSASALDGRPQAGGVGVGAAGQKGALGMLGARGGQGGGSEQSHVALDWRRRMLVRRTVRLLASRKLNAITSLRAKVAVAARETTTRMSSETQQPLPEAAKSGDASGPEARSSNVHSSRTGGSGGVNSVDDSCIGAGAITAPLSVAEKIEISVLAAKAQRLYAAMQEHTLWRLRGGMSVEVPVKAFGGSLESLEKRPSSLLLAGEVDKGQDGENETSTSSLSSSSSATVGGNTDGRTLPTLMADVVGDVDDGKAGNRTTTTTAKDGEKEGWTTAAGGEAVPGDEQKRIAPYEKPSEKELIGFQLKSLALRALGIVCGGRVSLEGAEIFSSERRSLERKKMISQIGHAAEELDVSFGEADEDEDLSADNDWSSSEMLCHHHQDNNLRGFDEKYSEPDDGTHNIHTTGIRPLSGSSSSKAGTARHRRVNDNDDHFQHHQVAATQLPHQQPRGPRRAAAVAAAAKWRDNDDSPPSVESAMAHHRAKSVAGGTTDNGAAAARSAKRRGGATAGSSESQSATSAHHPQNPVSHRPQQQQTYEQHLCQQEMFAGGGAEGVGMPMSSASAVVPAGRSSPFASRRGSSAITGPQAAGAAPSYMGGTMIGQGYIPIQPGAGMGGFYQGGGGYGSMYGMGGMAGYTVAYGGGLMDNMMHHQPFYGNGEFGASGMGPGGMSMSPGGYGYQPQHSGMVGMGFFDLQQVHQQQQQRQQYHQNAQQQTTNQQHPQQRPDE